MFLSRRWTAILATIAIAAVFCARSAQAADAPQRDITSLVNGQRVKRLTSLLALTSEQQQKFLSLMAEESKLVAQAQEDSSIERPERVAKQSAIKADYRKKMEEHLTKEQREKWAKNDAENEAARKKKRPASSGATPKKDEPAK